MTPDRDADDSELRRLLDLGGLDSFGGESDLKASRDPASAERAESMLRRVLESPKRGVPDAHARPRSRTARIAAVAATVAAVATVAVFAITGRLHGPSATDVESGATPAGLAFNSPTPTGATALLSRLASLHPRSEGTIPSNATVQRIYSYQWQQPASTDPDPLAVTERQTFVFPNGAIRSSTRTAGEISALGRLDVSAINAGTPRWSSSHTPSAVLRAFSRTGTQQLDALAQLGGCRDRTAECVLDGLTQLNLEHVIDAATMRRLWTNLAAEPGIETLGTTTDRLGRPAVSLVADRPTGGQRTMILIAPKTGAFLGSEQLVVDGNTASTRAVAITTIARTSWIRPSLVPPAAQHLNP